MNEIKVPNYKRRYGLTAKRYRVKQVSFGFIPQWRIWWLPLCWCVFDMGQCYACFDDLVAAREHIRKDNMPRFQTVIHDA